MLVLKAESETILSVSSQLGAMKQLLVDAQAVYRAEGLQSLLTKAVRTVLEPFVGADGARRVYHDLNRVLTYRSVAAPTFDVPQNAINIHPDGFHTFFGFYDHTPFCHENRRVLFHRIQAPMTPASRSRPIELWYYDLEEHSATQLGESDTWNWQKGCRLRWHPTAPDTVVYNTLVDSGYGAVFHDVSDGEVTRRFRAPIYDVDQSGRYALSINFSRLERLHFDYGYTNLSDETEGERVPEDDGIYRLDLETGRQKLLFSYADLASAVETPPSVEPYAMNLMISPDGKRFCFLYRYHEDGVRVTKLACATMDGNTLRVLQDDAEASHPAWRSETELLCTVNHWGAERKTEYVLFDVESSESTVIRHAELDVDTHPSFSPVDTDLFVGDTYPDHCGERHLYLYSISEGCYDSIGTVYGPVKHGIKRDFHPRWDREGKYVCVDAPQPQYSQSVLVVDVEQRSTQLARANDTEGGE